MKNVNTQVLIVPNETINETSDILFQSCDKQSENIDYTEYLTRLQCHIKERRIQFQQVNEKIFNLSIMLIDFSSSQRQCTHIRQSLKTIQDILRNTLVPLWNLNQDITNIHNDISSIYNDLLNFSKFKQGTQISFILSRLDLRLHDINRQKKLDRSNLNGKKTNSFLAGESVIAVLNEQCFRLQEKIGHQDYNELVLEFSGEVKVVGQEMLAVSEQRLLFAKKWVKNVLSDLDLMQCRVECSLLKDL